MQKLKIEKPMTKTYNAESSPSSQRSENAKTFEKAWNKQRNGRRYQS